MELILEAIVMEFEVFVEKIYLWVRGLCGEYKKRGKLNSLPATSRPALLP